MDFRNWLAEMPIQQMHFIGNWNRDDPKHGMPHYNRPGLKGKPPHMGWHKDDFGILTNPTGLSKNFGFHQDEAGAVTKDPETEKWKCEQPFNLLLIRTKEGARVREVGEVDLDYIHNTLRIPDPPIDPSTINVFYTNNRGAERVPFFKWTPAHRVGHAIRQTPGYEYFTKDVDKEMYELLQGVYNYQRKSDYGYGAGYEREGRSRENNQKMLMALAMGIGTMQSARKRLLRNFGEFYHELTAQYIVEGKITLQPPPSMLPTHFAWGNAQGRYRQIRGDDMEGWADFVTDHMAPLWNSNIGSALDKCIGKIFVM